jgi:hypothetical protein
VQSVVTRFTEETGDVLRDWAAADGDLQTIEDALPPLQAELETAQQALRDHDAQEAAPAPPAEPRPATERPLLGTGLTHPLVPFVIGLVLACFEGPFGDKVFKPLLPLPGVLPTILAILFVLVLTFAVDVAARVCAPYVKAAQRRVQILVVTILALAIVAGATTTAVLYGEARPTNIAYSEARKPANIKRGLSFSAPARDADDAGGALNQPVAAPAPPKGPARPDARFVIPMTLVGLLAAFGLSLRCGLAEAWHDELRRQAMLDAQRLQAAELRVQARQRLADAVGEARQSLGRVQASHAAAGGRVNACTLELGRLAFQAESFTRTIVGTIQDEYGRHCAGAGNTVPPLPLAPVPDFGAIAATLAGRLGFTAFPAPEPPPVDPPGEVPPEGDPPGEDPPGEDPPPPGPPDPEPDPEPEDDATPPGWSAVS